MSILASLEPEKKFKALPDDTQQVCIDLPGEDVRCVVHKPKLVILLRKHRDVIFDIAMFNGMHYTIEADKSDFYNAGDKKIVLRKKRQTVSFVDGEQLHLWLPRKFAGHLILKANGKVLGRYQPSQLDPSWYNDDPATKAAPIMVVMHNPGGESSAATAPQTLKPSLACTKDNPLGLAGPVTDIKTLLGQQTWNDPLQIMMPTQTEDQSMHVVEVVSQKNAPPEVIAFIMNGGDATELDPNGIVTRNWILSQLFGSEAYLIDNRSWAKELMDTRFWIQRVKHKNKVGTYIVFKGKPGLRKLMNAARYSVQNTKIVKITAGAGSAKQAWQASKGAAKDSIKIFAREEGKLVFKAGGVAVLLTIGMDTAEWYKDYSDIGPDGKPKRNFIDLFAKIGVDAIKAGLSAAVASAAVGLALGFLIGIGVVAAGSIATIVIGTIFAAVVVGYVLDYLDKQVGRALGEDDMTSWISKNIHLLASRLSSNLPKENSYDAYETMFIPAQ